MRSDSFATYIGHGVLLAGGLALASALIVAAMCIVAYAGLWVIVGPRNVWKNWQEARLWLRFGRPKYRPAWDKEAPDA